MLAVHGKKDDRTARLLTDRAYTTARKETAVSE
jgi:hypothetical protein